ncbi:MAG TPA: hypothetical protein ENJ56_04725 [Anaerolineae bacterium]|nr:hypothetical protein [Anaerolineae bacterium]
MVGKIPIITGGTLIFIATILLILQLAGMKPNQTKSKEKLLGAQGNKFYIAGLAYFLLGIIIGTGLWTGWMQPLGVTGKPVEVHIHANNWGLLSLVFAGLIIDLYPVWTGKQFANPKTINIIFWAMVTGAFGLIFGPWFSSKALLVPGLVLHLGATILLLVNYAKPLHADGGQCSIGLKHVLLSYLWILAPVLMAPFVLFGVGNLPAATIESNAPQALVYGWILQFGIAVFPYFFSRALHPEQKSHKLGGSMLTLVLMNIGGIFLWASIFSEPSRGLLSGIAYFLWSIALTSVVVELWGMIRASLGRLEKGLGVA